ncbi:MAG: asparagine synthase (glutamine-hydrolyzing) [Anaerolineae bacterium]|nr:asparagine synthase (glutamine-hydrolyzing) [Anaerolineae bacterium]
MCGITGKLHFDPHQSVDENLIHRMNTLLIHRGPDDDGVWSNGPIGLGQRRLAIIDLSPTGRQPMRNEDGAIWLTFNGEIYNHLELRANLEKRGHHYRGVADTETILHLYEEYGRDCVRHLRGMFAFALWDERRHSLLLARDRFGQKPLLYAQTADGLTFASEIKALLQDPAVSRNVDETALHHYLTYGYIPTPLTAFSQIRKLPPASTLFWENGHISIERYWRLRYTPKLKLTEAEAAERLLELLRQATRLRLMSDVPLGAFLSGGIDSGAVVALMAQATPEPVKTFSIGFAEQSFDELPYARQVAEWYATDHHEFIVRPDALAVLPELVWAYGEPYADSSALPTYYVARETRRHVIVALNGDGGDEAFAGYDRYLALRLAGRYERAPRWLRRGVINPLAQRLPETTGRKDFWRRLKRFVLAADAAPSQRYARWTVLLSNPDKARLYTPDFQARLAAVDSLDLIEQLYAAADTNDAVEQAQFVDAHLYLPDDLLVKVDIATMVHSLEARSPFLDHQLAEFAAQLPVDYKLRGRVSKYILKHALRRHLPEAVLRRDKQGFALPLGRWFRHQLRPVAETVLLDPATLHRGLFARAGVTTMLNEHVSGRANHWQRIWQLLMLELWFRTYVDRPRSALFGSAEGIL